MGTMKRLERAWRACAIFSLLLMGLSAWAGKESGLVGHWTFDAGKGSVVRDHSGHGHDGKIVNAVRTRTKSGGALRFDGSADYVDCGKPAGLMLTGDMTIMAWIKTEASPFPNYETNWYIVDCEDYNNSGFMARVDGSSSRLCFRTSRKGRNQGGFSRVALENNVFYHVVFVRKNGDVTFCIDGVRDITFKTRDPAIPTNSFKISSVVQSFQGVIDDLRVYNRALRGEEILCLYKEGAQGHGKDTSWINRIILRPFFRFDRKQIVVEADFRGIMPLQPGAQVSAEVGPPGGAAVLRLPVGALPESGRCDFPFSVAKFAPGQYEVRFACRGPKTDITEKVVFHYPPVPPNIPDPEKMFVPPLPPELKPIPCRVRAGRNGGFTVIVKGRRFAVESFFSFPRGGENALVPDAPPRGCEPGWRVKARSAADRGHRITGEGRHYRIERRIQVLPGRVAVSDTITNKTAQPIGILIRHRLRTGALPVEKAYLAGYGAESPFTRESIKTNPTVFLQLKQLGLGLLARDDVFIVQSAGAFEKRVGVLRTDEFALDAGASYALEWSVYANETSDYYDFINAIRRDEGRNFVTVEGGFAGAHIKGNRRVVPTGEYLELRGAKHVRGSCVARIADDPAISLEGIEFMYYPKEKALLARQMRAIRRAAAGVTAGFHIAHSLFATNTPDKIFPDSRVIKADGSQAIYSYNYRAYSYFSKERVDAGWRWWIYYPTLDNSFGKALLKSVDVMVDEMGCTNVFMDGFHWAYGGQYTYDRWDGHTAEIDPKTKTIKRKRGSVLLLSQPAIVAFTEKLVSNGAVVIANNAIITRTIGKLDIITDKEITEGPNVHLAQTPIAMGNPSAIKSERDVHYDVCRKLAWGNLYMYYGEKTLTYPSVPQQMYPITVQEIRSGLVKGKERLITTRSGVYGWRGSDDLHFAYRYDGRGYPVDHGFGTTADNAGVRTRIALKDNEAAVLKRIPVSLKAARRVNVICRRYGAKGITLLLNGTGRAAVRVRNGEFAVQPNTAYVVTAEGTQEVRADARGELTFTLSLRGPTTVTAAQPEAR